MANFQLRDVDDELWSAAMVRAQIEGWSLRQLILALLKDYTDGTVRPSADPPLPRARRIGPYVQLRFTCPYCNQMMLIDVLHTTGFEHMRPIDVACPNCHRVTRRMLPGQPKATIGWIDPQVPKQE